MSDRESQIRAQCDSQQWESAFSLLVDAYSEQLYWTIRQRVGTHADSNDVLQEVFILVWKNLPRFEWRSKLSSWLFRIAINESYTHLRKLKRSRAESLEDGASLELERLKSDSWFDGDAAILKLEAAIRALPPKQRQVFELRYYEDLPYEEIHEILGVSVGALKAQYHHAQKKVRNSLEED
jgi:RNA polymerase sigma-70 factor (ECF subfamily)